MFRRVVEREGEDGFQQGYGPRHNTLVPTFFVLNVFEEKNFRNVNHEEGEGHEDAPEIEERRPGEHAGQYGFHRNHGFLCSMFSYTRTRESVTEDTTVVRHVDCTDKIFFSLSLDVRRFRSHLLQFSSLVASPALQLLSDYSPNLSS